MIRDSEAQARRILRERIHDALVRAEITGGDEPCYERVEEVMIQAVLDPTCAWAVTYLSLIRRWPAEMIPRTDQDQAS